MSKIAIILYAEPGTQDFMGRSLYSLLYTKELKEHRHDVLLIFDGGATKWMEEFVPNFLAVKTMCGKVLL